MAEILQVVPFEAAQVFVSGCGTVGIEQRLGAHEVAGLQRLLCQARVRGVEQLLCGSPFSFRDFLFPQYPFRLQMLVKETGKRDRQKDGCNKARFLHKRETPLNTSQTFDRETALQESQVSVDG